MKESYRNTIFETRMAVLTANGLSENDAFDIAKSIRNAEHHCYANNEDLRKYMEPLEQQGRVLDIYNNMPDKDRQIVFLTHGYSQDEAESLSNNLKETENAVIAMYDESRDRTAFKEQRDKLINDAAEALQELREYAVDGNGIAAAGRNIEDVVTSSTNRGISTELASTQYVRSNIMAIPMGREHPAVMSMVKFDGCLNQLMADGMPMIIADSRIVAAGIEMERNKAMESEFADGVESIIKPDVQQEV